MSGRAGPDLAMRFYGAVVSEVYDAVKARAGFEAKALRKMLIDHGGIATAKRLLKGSSQSGFRGLRRSGCLDVTIEHLVMQHPWRKLFTPKELGTAKMRLESWVTRARKGEKPYREHSCSADDCPLSRSSRG
jgi:hypothetical protein